MYGKAWHISCCIAAIDHGEENLTGESVAEIANKNFKNIKHPAFPDDAEIVVREFRKHIAFIVEPPTPSDVFIKLLAWALYNKMFCGPRVMEDMIRIREERKISRPVGTHRLSL